MTRGFWVLSPIGTMSALRSDSDRGVDPNTWEIVGSGIGISVRATADCFDNTPTHFP